MNLVEKAERKSRDRAIVFYLLALCLLMSAMTSVHIHDDSSERLIPWFFMVGGAALNLTSMPFRLWKWNGMATLLNDETTRDHRRSSFTAGFWVMLAVAAMIVGLARFHALDAEMAGRIIITAGLMTALIAFATLELRASR